MPSTFTTVICIIIYISSFISYFARLSVIFNTQGMIFTQGTIYTITPRYFSAQGYYSYLSNIDIFYLGCDLYPECQSFILLEFIFLLHCPASFKSLKSFQIYLFFTLPKVSPYLSLVFFVTLSFCYSTQDVIHILHIYSDKHFSITLPGV